jgi:hypothetical protein
MFSNFTKKHYKYFLINKYNLNNNNCLVLLLNNEKKNINNFFKNSKIDISYESNNYAWTQDLIIKFTKMYFVDPKVIEKLKDLNKTVIIKWKTNTIILRINDSNDKFNLILLKINVMIHIIEYIGNNLSDVSFNNLMIILILTDLEKIEPNINEIINVKHINSGFTEHNLNKTIYIWRYEEFEKVLFHEIIHVLNLDKSEDKTIKIINSRFHNYFEAITDFYAILYHIIYISLITNIKPKLILEIELAFIKNQAMKMNNIFKLKDWDKNSNLNINQYSNGFSYYILKYLVFEYILELNEKDLLIYLKKINYNIFLKNILKKKFINYNYNNIKSLRMTLFQLKYL